MTLLIADGNLSSDYIRRKAAEVIQRPAYQLDPIEPSGLWWIDWLERASKWLIRPFRNFFESLSDISPILAWMLIVVLTVLLTLIFAHILYTVRAAMRTRSHARSYDLPERQIALDPAVLEQQASESAEAGEYILAIRFLFRACLIRIERAQERTFREGTTNREYLRRYQRTAISEPLRLFVDTIDLKWYGHEVCREQDYLGCAQAHLTIRNHAAEMAHAHSA